MKSVLIVAGIVVALWLLHRFLESLHQRGLIHYRLGVHNKYASAGSALLQLHAIAQPKMHIVAEARHQLEERREDHGQSGDAPPEEEFWR
jgi:DNA-binding IclR family transcriptional regulator